jgi:sulfite exporter TauE/SafE
MAGFPPTDPYVVSGFSRTDVSGFSRTGVSDITRSDADVAAAYPLARRLSYLLLAAALGIVVAGFWNFRVVDGFGADIVAANTIGDYRGKSGEFAILGATFGFLFAFVAGLAATFTACNCVAFAMIPGLVCAPDARAGRAAALRALRIMLACVVGVSGVYGAFVGWLGPTGVAAINAREVRFAQAGIVFSVLGMAMLVWGAIELGLLNRFTRRCSAETRAFFAQPTTKAAIMGLMIGAFSVGRPYPVFREFLLYAAQAQSPMYGAAVMALQGIGQIVVMVAAFLAILWLLGEKLASWVVKRSAQPALVSACALAAGGAYFVFYWGIARAWPWMGRWGFQLGWY